MIIRKADRQGTTAVRFHGKGEVSMLPVMPPVPESFHSKGRIFSEVVLRPGQSFGVHTHTGDFEICFFLSGEGSYNDNGVCNIVYPGDVAVCEDGGTHGIENTGKEDLRYIALVLYTA